MALPLGLGFAVTWLWLPPSDYRFAQSLFVGTAMAVTALPVAVRVLRDLGQLDTQLSRTVTAAALLEGRATDSVRNAQVFAEAIVATVRQPLVVLDAGLRVVTANRAFYQTFDVSEGQTVGRRVYELGDGQWDKSKLRKLLEEIIPQNTQFEDFEMVHDFPNIGRKRVLLDARRIEQQGERPHLVLLTIREIQNA